jgi:3-oxoacyl-(acyl-carrier-protein) synthase
MTPAILVTGLGQHSTLGSGLAPLREALRSRSVPTPTTRTVRTRHGVRQIPVFEAPDISLPSRVPDTVKRRMARITRMSFAATQAACEDAFGSELQTLALRPQRVGLVVGTAFACMDLANDYQQRVLLGGAIDASPNLFSSSVQNAIASQLSISLGIQGPMSTVTTMEHTAIGALHLAVDWLNANLIDHAIIAIGDELSEFHAYTLAHLEMASAFNPMSDACSAIAGEGIASFVLSRADAPGARQRYCQIVDVQPFAETCPAAPRYLAACYGAAGQWSQHVRWIGEKSGTVVEPLCHARLFGSMVTTAAFEILIGALLTSQDHRATTCVQLSSQAEAQTLSLG